MKRAQVVLTAVLTLLCWQGASGFAGPVLKPNRESVLVSRYVTDLIRVAERHRRTTGLRLVRVDCRESLLGASPPSGLGLKRCTLTQSKTSISVALVTGRRAEVSFTFPKDDLFLPVPPLPALPVVNP